MWRPVHEAHSISEMNLSLELDRAVSTDELGRVAAAKDSFPNLPGVNVGRALPFPMQSIPILPSRSHLPIVGVTFDRFTPAGAVAERLALQGNVAGYVTSEYTRWRMVSENAFNCMATLLNLLDDVNVTALVLRYVDKFISGQVDNTPDASAMFRLSSKYLSPAIISTTDLAHSHTGFYRNMSEGTALVNLNVDFLDENDMGRVTSIMTFIRLVLDKSVTKDDVAGDGGLKQGANEMHSLGKEFLMDMLVEPLAEKIGLKSA